MQRLRLAAGDIDRELDTALTCVGVLPPLDLEPIRNLLSRTDLEIQAMVNNDGHRMIAMIDGRREVAMGTPRRPRRDDDRRSARRLDSRALVEVQRRILVGEQPCVCAEPN
jgi:hypothetical protein